jgi:Bacterial SH3 domain
MKTMLLATVAIAMTTAAYAVVPAQNKDTQTRCLIQGDGLNIRETPDLDGNVVAALESSDTVILHRVVTGREGRRWAHIEVPNDGEGSSDGGYEGWVSYKYLTCQGSQPHETQSSRPQRRVRYYARSPMGTIGFGPFRFRLW